jgi:hypothetical protein
MVDTARSGNSKVRSSRRTACVGTLSAALCIHALLFPAATLAANEAAPQAAMSGTPAAAGTADATPRRPPLPGQLSTRFGIDDASPEASVPSVQERNRNPLEFGYYLQDLLEKAEKARKNKDYSTVIRYYRAVAKAVPDNAKGWSKLCEAYEVVHDRDRAIVACRYAIERPAAEAQDFVRYVHLIIDTPQVTAKEKTELDAVLTHLDEADATGLVANHLRCEVGVKLKSVGLMETCLKVLAKKAPDDPKTVVFRWALAVMKGQTEEANRLLVYARAAGVGTENVERMESITPSARGTSWRRAGIAGATAVVGLALLAGLLAAIRRRRSPTSRPAT